MSAAHKLALAINFVGLVANNISYELTRNPAFFALATFNLLVSIYILWKAVTYE